MGRWTDSRQKPPNRELLLCHYFTVRLNGRHEGVYFGPKVIPVHTYCCSPPPSARQQQPTAYGGAAMIISAREHSHQETTWLGTQKIDYSSTTSNVEPGKRGSMRMYIKIVPGCPCCSSTLAVGSPCTYVQCAVSSSNVRAAFKFANKTMYSAYPFLTPNVPDMRARFLLSP